MIQNGIRALIILLTCILPIFGYAQTPQEIESKMDEIKLDERYVYGEGFNEDKDTAFQKALTELTTFVNELRVEKGKKTLNPSDLLTVVKELKYKKGSKHTVLVYLSLPQVFDLKSKSGSEVVGQNKSSQSNQSGDIPQQKKEQKTTTPTTVAEQQKEATSPTPSVQKSATNDIIKTLCSQDNWLEIKGFITTWKQEGRISMVGNTVSYREVPDDAIAILMDDMGGILSILSPKNSENQVNYRTNQNDSEKNHSNCKFIVWYK